MKRHLIAVTLLLMSLFVVANSFVSAQILAEEKTKIPLQHGLMLTTYGNYMPLAGFVNASAGIEWVVRDQKRSHVFSGGFSNGWFETVDRNLKNMHRASPYFVYGIYWGKKRIQPEVNLGVIMLREKPSFFALYPILTGGIRYYAASNPLMLRAGVGTGGLVIGLGWRLSKFNLHSTILTE
jgi:hypothetical protein